jgi:hypothetical protein
MSLHGGARIASTPYARGGAGLMLAPWPLRVSVSVHVRFCIERRDAIGSRRRVVSPKLL